MRFNIIALAYLFSINSLANVLVVEGKPYKIEPMQLNVCGEIGDPYYKAALGLLISSQKAGELTADAACKAGKLELCSQEAKNKLGLELLFTQIRKYPSRLKNPGCLELRRKCENLCEDSKLFSQEDCFIECNQYESFNK